jgi:uncharacterized protein YbjT (DUF2867 family)
MILVTGATGTNGIELIRCLSKLGAPFRGMGRKPPKTAGVEWVIGDFEDPDSLRKALAGVERVFLLTKSSETVEAQQLRFVELARAAGVQHIVYLSQLHADSNSSIRFLRYHGIVEEAIRASGMHFTNLRPNLYMQNLLQAFAPSLKAKRSFFAPAGSSRVSLIDVRDTAEVAAAALTQNAHYGKTYDLTGPDALTHAEMADQLSQVIGMPIQFVDVPEQAMRDALAGIGFPEWQAEGLIEDYAHYRRGEAAAISSDSEAITGHPARSLATFLADHKEELLSLVR